MIDPQRFMKLKELSIESIFANMTEHTKNIRHKYGIKMYSLRTSCPKFKFMMAKMTV